MPPRRPKAAVVDASRAPRRAPSVLEPAFVLFPATGDGVVSAALLIALLGRPMTPYPVADVAGAFSEAPDLRLSAILNLPYRPEAPLFFSDEERHPFGGIDSGVTAQGDQLHHWDSRFRTCADLVLDALSEAHDAAEIRARFSEWTDWARALATGSVSVRDAAFVGDSTTPTLLHHVLEHAHPDERELVQYVVRRIFAGDSVSKVSQSNRIRRIGLDLGERQRFVRDKVAGRIERLGDVAILDASDTTYAELAMLFFHIPEARFGVLLRRARRGAAGFEIVFGPNVWHRSLASEDIVSTAARERRADRRGWYYRRHVVAADFGSGIASSIARELNNRGGADTDAAAPSSTHAFI